MMKTFVTCLATALLCVLLISPLAAQQPEDGQNSFRLAAVNDRLPVGEVDSAFTLLTGEAGRYVTVAHDPDLDGDGLPEILVTQYDDGGRVFVFEVIENDKLEFVWASKILNPGVGGFGSTPRSVSIGDFDNNGKQEIIIPIGYGVDSLSHAIRGLYFYEFTGNDNDYGSEPVRIIRYDEIDPVYDGFSIGLMENGIQVMDVDDDGKNELLFPPRIFTDFGGAALHILEIESGTFAEGNDSLEVEYIYEDFSTALAGGTDGYTALATAVGNIDADPATEIAVAGWTIVNQGAGVGFIEVTAPDTYTPGSVVPISTENIFIVKAGIDIVEANGNSAVVLSGGFLIEENRNVWVIENILSEALVSETDLNVINSGNSLYGIMDIGDNDHGTGSDGFDIYYTNASAIYDLEYNGTGDLSDSLSYTDYGRIGDISLSDIYDHSGGLFNSIYAAPGLDLDADGKMEIVVSYKGDGSSTSASPEVDSLAGEPFTTNTYGIYIFEWGDPAEGLELTLTSDVADRGWQVITPEDYTLEQNYPNPFNPETNIQFSLPINKKVSLKIYNIRGKEIATLVDARELTAGAHTVTWNGKNNAGIDVPSGTYIYRLTFGNFSKSHQMTLIR